MKFKVFVLFSLIGVSFGNYHLYQKNGENNGPYGGGNGGYYDEGRNDDRYDSSSSSSSSSSSESEEFDLSNVNPACGTCSTLAVKTGSGSGVDEPITQTITTLSNGCKTISVTCKAATSGSEINLFWLNGENIVKSESGTTTITRNLVCDYNGQLGLIGSEGNGIPDKVECISAPAPCSICRTPLRLQRYASCTVGSSACTAENVISVTCSGTDCSFYLEKELNSEVFVDIGLSADIRCDSNGFYIGADSIGRLECDTPDQ